MLRSSLPLGRLMGVDLRLHISFLLLLVIAVAYSEWATHAPLRGIALWLALVLAVAVRELARAIAAAYAGLRLLAVYLLPVGGVIAFAPREKTANGKIDTRLVSVAGPAANFGVGLMMAAAAYGIDPHAGLVAQPWIGTEHILRSFVWMELLLGAVSLLPASAVPSRQMLRMRQGAATESPRTGGVPGLPGLSLGTALAFGLMAIGLVTMTMWPVIFGAFVLLYAQLSSQTLSSPEAEAILVREVMLTEYTLLATTDTLRDALDRTIHSLQDVFPVVRGNLLVGSVARQTILERLMREGDGYLQGVMTRSLQIAAPRERLVDALRRSATLGASEFIPVVDDDAVLGILTPQALTRAVQQLQLSRSPSMAQEQQ